MHKLGRLPRKYDIRIPRMKTLIKAQQSPQPYPIAIDYSAGLPDDLGEFMNDHLGDCTCAAFYHARQIWTGKADGAMITEPDKYAVELYEQACGYSPSDPSTDQGGVEQDVLAYLLNTGALITSDTPARGTDISKILAYAEIDQRNFDDLRRTIAECGVAYIGVEVPQSVMDNAGDITKPWDVGGNTAIAGGHAIILVGYDVDSFTAISWGKRYKLTNAFLYAHLDEAYGIIDRSWIEASGKTPFGMTLEQLESAMEALKC